MSPFTVNMLTWAFGALILIVFVHYATRALIKINRRRGIKGDEFDKWFKEILEWVFPDVYF